MANSFTIDITMSAATVTQLQQEGFQLYGFSGVDGTTINGSFPTLWFATSDYSESTTVEWTEQYGGYTTTQVNIAPGTVIIASASAPMNLGQLGTVGVGGVITVTNNGTAGEIELLNSTNTPFTCGITILNPLTGQSNPICAFPLNGQNEDVFVPVEMVLLMFATTPINTGTVIEQSSGPGILVNMTGQTSPAPLTYDVNNGWTGPGFTMNVSAGTPLPPLLINGSGVELRREKRNKRASARR